MKNKYLHTILRWLLCAIIIFVAYWFVLPPINYRSSDFLGFLVFCIVVCSVVNAFSQIITLFKDYRLNQSKINRSKFFKNSGKSVKVAILSLVIVLLFSLIASISGAKIFNASRYVKLIKMEEGNFSEDVAEINKSQIPVVDKDTASRLGQRKLGEMSDLVSQFVIQEDYTQINYKGKPVRVTPLAYGDIIKWFNNQKGGIPAYIAVDMTTQETTLVRLKDGIKYSTGEYFLRNLDRYLRFNYPTKIFDNISFEIDEDGTPFWVASVVDFKIGIWSGKDVGGAVLVNAVTGESKYYKLDDIPTWVDQVYDSQMILNQLSYNGKYRSGYLNSIFGQRGVLQPTDGHNYLAINDDVYLYTGMTSVTSDESNVGFVLVNLRTKDTKFYSIPGAEEYSAMSSAEGQVQHLKYTATFPLLLNISDRPTYFLALKDAAGLVKMYAFVDVKEYQTVGTGNTVDEARSNYISKLKNNNPQIEDSTQITVAGNIEQIASAVVEGNTCYFIKLNGKDVIYTVPVNLSDKLPFASIGNTVELTLNDSDEVTEIDFK